MFPIAGFRFSGFRWDCFGVLYFILVCCCKIFQCACPRNQYLGTNNQCLPCLDCKIPTSPCDVQCLKWRNCDVDQYYDKVIEQCRPCYECRRERIGFCNQCSDEHIYGAPPTVASSISTTQPYKSSASVEGGDGRIIIIVTIAVAAIFMLLILVIITIAIVMCRNRTRGRRWKHSETISQAAPVTESIPLNSISNETRIDFEGYSTTNGGNQSLIAQESLIADAGDLSLHENDRMRSIGLSLREEARGPRAEPVPLAVSPGSGISYSLTGQPVCQESCSDFGSMCMSPRERTIPHDMEEKSRLYNGRVQREYQRPYRTLNEDEIGNVAYSVPGYADTPLKSC